MCRTLGKDLDFALELFPVMRVGVVTFLGSNCDDDAIYAFSTVLGVPTVRLYYYEERIPELDLIVLPGGFSYGDYLRAGAIARFAPIIPAVKDFAERGGLVLGICNGFQILCESGLLSGALIRNASLGFICRWVYIRVEKVGSPFTFGLSKGEVLKIPIAHGEGNFVAPAKTLTEIEDSNLVVFRYCDERGELTPSANPNGSMNFIAGLTNPRGNVLGMMPHPERACEKVLGSEDGLKILTAVKAYLEGNRVFVK